MSPDFVLKKLKKRLQEKRLAHLYLIRNRSGEFSFLDFYKNFIATFLGKNITQHPDILWVEIDKDESIYKVDSDAILRFLKFLNYRPVNLEHKFVFISDAHLISEVLLNKLLKTLEELDEQTTIFLGAPTQHEILATIKSRSIEISLTSGQKDQTTMPNNYELKYERIINDLKKEATTEDAVLDQMLFNLLNKNYKELDSALEKIKNYQSSYIFNNNKNSRISSLLP